MEDYAPIDGNAFIPFSVAVDTDLDASAIMACSLPGGRSVADVVAQEDTKTTSTNGSTLFKGVISSWHHKKIRSWSGSYIATDIDGSLIRLSGRIIVPADGNVSRIMIVNHFTIGADSEAPSNEITLESIFAARGIAVIEPDYLGYGITADRIHPYLCSDITAYNVVQMYYAALPFLKQMGCSPKYDDIFILGYSQGGAVSVAVAQEIERNHPGIDIRLVMCGGGPYDICTTYDKLIDNDFSDYPSAIPLIVQGMNYGMSLNLDYKDFFQPRMLENMDEWINSKKYTMAQITELIGSKKVSSIMTDEAMDKSRDLMTDLYRAMVDNSVVNGPGLESPVYMFHSMDDNVVPYENIDRMVTVNYNYKVNVQYNLGHYGNHVAGCLRFLYSALQLLYDNGDIDRVM